MLILPLLEVGGRLVLERRQTIDNLFQESFKGFLKGLSKNLDERRRESSRVVERSPRELL